MKKYTIKDINNISIAENILKSTRHKRYSRKDFKREVDWIRYKLETIIKAANFIDNDNKLWELDWTYGNSQYKYYNYFYKAASGGGWVYYGYDGCYCSTSCSVGLYYKNNKTAVLIGKKHIDLYVKLIENKD